MSRRDRKRAAKLAALALSGGNAPLEGWAPTIWSLTVFFEEYIRKGALRTRKDFGPRDKPLLKIVRSIDPS